MPYDPEKHHRRSIRLPGYDYSASGAYFITICVRHRSCFFGHVHHSAIQLNAAGQMLRDTWASLPVTVPNVSIDESVVMPNHFHGIVWITASNTSPDGKHCSLGEIVARFKSLTTNHYIRGVKQSDWPRFDRHLWQVNYFEHIIRNDESLAAIREYIRTNPERWEADVENPAGTGADDPERWIQEMTAHQQKKSNQPSHHEGRPQGSPLQ